MIVNYSKRYDEEVKNLLMELQEHIASIDREGFNILTPEYREEYFKKTLDEIKKSKGKMFLYKEDGKIVGLVVGLIMEAINEYDFCAPKRGIVTELVVSKHYRAKGCGSALLERMEAYLKSQDCQHILLRVFGYNDRALAFYQKHGYTTRLYELSKKV